MTQATLPASARCLLLLLALAAGSHAWAWGCAGHQIIAAIALLRLDPATRAQVNAILAADPRSVGPTRACPAAGLPLLVSSASWADVRRNGATAPEHDADLPLTLGPNAPSADAVYAQACADRCVSWAILHYARVLAVSDDAAERGKALRYLEHFVGDVHQPLHTVGDDRGGSTLKIYLGGSGRETTLHVAWDSGIPARLEGGLSTTAYAAQINAQLGSEVAAELDQEAVLGNDGPEAWAWQSHALAVRFAFGHLPASGGELGPAYLASAASIIPLQLERAGQRLARLLQRQLAPSPTSSGITPQDEKCGLAAASDYEASVGPCSRHLGLVGEAAAEVGSRRAV